jgi:hypothetical protein
MTKSSGLRRFIRWVFVNRRTGRITVAQWPNIALWSYAALSFVGHVDGVNGTAQQALQLGSVVALVVWAADELIRGVNPFRRILGVVVLLATTIYGAHTTL